MMKTREAKTVEQWRQELDQESRGDRGKFRILPRALFNSPAFAALGGAATVVVLAVLNKLHYEKQGTKDRKGVKIGQGLLRNNGEFVLTINELVARGLSRSTATRARFIVWETGFFDVMEPGTIHHAGRYRYSERWKEYPNGDYRPVGQQFPGKNLYPENGFKKTEESRSDTPVENDKVIFPEYLKAIRS
jgi:hypothetical protein